MEIYVLVMFILYITSIGVYSVQLEGEYPRTKVVNKSSDIIGLIISVGLAIWTGYLVL